MKGILRKSSAQFVIVKGHESRGKGSSLSFPDEFSARAFVRQLLREKSNTGSLRRYLLRAGFVTNLSRLDDRKLIREFARRLVSGRIRIVRVDKGTHPARWAIPGGTSTQREEKPTEERPRPRPVAFTEVRDTEETRNWVKFRVVDDETGEPVQGVTLKLKLPSGEVGKPTTNRRGGIDLYDLTPGTVDIQEIIDSDALEVVGME